MKYEKQDQQGKPAFNAACILQMRRQKTKLKSRHHILRVIQVGTFKPSTGKGNIVRT
jgi:hypothetical protein